MTPFETASKLKSIATDNPLDPGAAEFFFESIKNVEQENFDIAHEMNRYLRTISSKALSIVRDGKHFDRFMELQKKGLLFDAKIDFDAYLRYLEWDREPTKKFYIPRRKVLLPLVSDMQDLLNRKITFLGISLPPRVGKSTLAIMYLTWIMGLNPDSASVMSGHSDKLTDGFYREALSILSDPTTYLWHDVFSDIKIADNSAKNETIDLNKKKRFPTFTARSIGGTLTGAVEIGENGILYTDDLIEDLEESLNPVRLQAKYDAYLNQLKDRKKEGAIELMVGTRWNVLDVLGRIECQYQDNSLYRFRTIPALNSDGESNFDYPESVGFSTAYYIDMKASIDDATWNAKYMGTPYVREGLLFPTDELRTYNGVLPDGNPDRILGVCDVAWGGGDSLAMVFAWIYGSDVYIGDVIFNGGDKDVTRPIVLGRMKRHIPHKARFEANNGGHEYSGIVDEKLRSESIHINITSVKAPSTQSKMSRIIQHSPDIKRFIFLDEKVRPKEYRAFMKELTTFVQTGKKPHDDAPDSLAMLADELYQGGNRVVSIRRPF